MRDPFDEFWFWLNTAALHATGSAAALINLAHECPPRPVPWYTWAYFWLALLMLSTTALWGCWLHWSALWQWAARAWSRFRRRQ